MAVINYTFSQLVANNWLFHPEKWLEIITKIRQQITSFFNNLLSSFLKIDVLFPIRNFLRNIKIDNPQFAIQLCNIIPVQCPFERDFKLFGKVLFHIPPMCKINPFYDDLMELRFRAQCYLADQLTIDN